MRLFKFYLRVNALINTSVRQHYLGCMLPSANNYTFHVARCNHCWTCRQTLC